MLSALYYMEAWEGLEHTLKLEIWYLWWRVAVCGRKLNTKRFGELRVFNRDVGGYLVVIVRKLAKSTYALKQVR